MDVEEVIEVMVKDDIHHQDHLKKEKKFEEVGVVEDLIAQTLNQEEIIKNEGKLNFS